MVKKKKQVLKLKYFCSVNLITMLAFGMYWWIQPPGIGPRGQDPSWKPVEIYVHEPGAGPAKTEVLDLLPEPATLPTGELTDGDPTEPPTTNSGAWVGSQRGATPARTSP